MTLLEVEDVRRTFGGIVALDGVTFDVTAGETHVVMGANGAGKTTLFNCITGYYRPDSGTVRYRGEDITGMRADRTARLGIRRTFQEVDVFDELTVAENISLASFETQPREIMARLDLIEIHDKYGDELTLFERKRVALALVTDGDLLLLDEVFSGVNPSEKPAMLGYLEELARDHTLVLIEHDIETAFELADRMVVLDQGRVLAHGSPGEIRTDETVQEQYLGEMAI
ncbi:ABC transporter ATP-binding protein [Halomarina halobia]|uniref:ABC transporter ATP-binding protein n=1 Tax=Halomarina halobia TaxID=3033386 RepID=A0ABD6AE15_9EURY|nr:ATP-binding cassette domain-containing protein [Halomarina sp. PSR21]